MFVFQDARAPVEVAFTDRHGGVSGGPFASLDLAEPRPGAAGGSRAGAGLPDPPPAEVRHKDLGEVGGQVRGAVGGGLRRDVAENLGLVARALASAGDETGHATRAGRLDAGPIGAGPGRVASPVAEPRIIRMRQVHGSDVHTVDPAWLATEHEPPTVDALVTDVPGVALLVRVADCVPVLLGDPRAGVVAAVHCGRLGLVAGVVPATLARMQELGALRVTAWVGPHVCGACYEVPAAMREEVASAVPASYAETSWGTPAVDVGAGVVAQLERAGVEVVDASRCTREDPDLYSHRRDGVRAGRSGGLVWMRP